MVFCFKGFPWLSFFTDAFLFFAVIITISIQFTNYITRDRYDYFNINQYNINNYTYAIRNSSNYEFFDIADAISAD